MRRIAVIIATYNGASYVEACFRSLEQADHDGLEVSFWAVDDGSTDATRDIISEKYPWVRLLRTPRNLGFAGSNNHAIRTALTEGYEGVYLLNQDTEVEPDFLTKAVAAIDRDGKIAAVQSLLVLHPETQLANSTGNAIHFLGLGYCLDYRRPLADIDLPRVDGRAIAYASGAGVLFRSSALQTVGLLDDDYYMYHEDLDLGWRLWLAGHEVRLAAESRVYHKYEFSRSIRKFFWMERNRYVTLFKCLSARSIAVLSPWLLLSEIALFFASVRGGWWRQKLKVYGWFLRPAHWREVGEKRRTVQSLRRRSDRELTRMFVATVDYQEVTGPFTRYVSNPLMRLAWAIIRKFI